MSGNPLKAIEYALENDVPHDPGKTLFINPHGLIDINSNDVTAIQSFKPWHDALTSQSDWHVVKNWTELDQDYDTALLMLPKQKDQARGWIARGFQLLKENGVIVCDLDNKAGGASWAKHHKETQTVSKHKSRVLWAQREKFIKEDVCATWIEDSLPQLQEETSLKAAPGMFSWRKPDIGSKLLLEHLPDRFEGHGADFCCGYGYLSHDILLKNPKTHITCIDASYDALMCAEENLRACENIEYMWEDLSQPLEGHSYDWIVMNPPFHEDISHASSLGQDCIKTASKSLSNGGVLYMVANQHLPYEKTLEHSFSTVEKVLEQNGFKIFKAVL